MSDELQNSSGLPDDMSEYLQTFLDETEEQLDALVETMLVLERNPESAEELNEAFRLIHSIKGSAGIMGFDSIAVLTHHLEDRFEQFRTNFNKLDRSMTNLVLRCIDFLRDCTDRLRSGDSLGNASDLIESLHDWEASEATVSQQSEPIEPTKENSSSSHLQDQDSNVLVATESEVLLRIQFEPGLQLADLKAQLIVSRLSDFGEIQSTQPTLDELETVEELTEFEVLIETTHPAEELRNTVNVDGVQSIFLEGGLSGDVLAERADAPFSEALDDEPHSAPLEEPVPVETTKIEPEPPLQLEENSAPSEADLESIATDPKIVETKPIQKVAETLRVDIDRLDNLINLAGELVVNRARFVQVSNRLSPELKKTNVVNRLRDLSETLLQTIESLRHQRDEQGDLTTHLQELEAGLELLHDQAEVMESSRRCFGQMSEAIDQLTRVSNKLQRGVLETRMVPVGPLFNRFKRVVRDLAIERGKQVNLELRGEKTELDKRMIDELGDPLVHLVRNSIDHGLESPDVRRAQGKPEVGTILLEASQRGQNVYVRIQDDGNGIEAEKIKAKIVDRGLLSFVAVEDLTDEEILDYIWHPGFSTAETITDVSGRGVGMDVVKTRIQDLNGTIEVESIPHLGTTFTIRLPLTLAIINSLLVRMRKVIFSIPISDVREIVSIQRKEIVSVHGRETFEVRGEFIPLVSIEDVFDWHNVEYVYCERDEQPKSEAAGFGDLVSVVILHTVGRTMGLRVEELLGGQEIVIKSLSENFVTIRGLSGASILGDGSVCLMLDVATVIDQASRASRMNSPRKEMYVESIG